jgi:hypothetical protein
MGARGSCLPASLPLRRPDRSCQAGYRHIASSLSSTPHACSDPRAPLLLQDSAEWYENEAEVGRAIRDWCTSTGTPRSAVFYTTKLKFNAGRAAVDKSIKKSVDACGLGYVGACDRLASDFNCVVLSCFPRETPVR